MNYLRPLQPGTSYHIFNHANGFGNVFREEKNYRFFPDKYRLHIAPIAETYAYCLMPNHFHLVVRIHKRPILENIFSKVSDNNFSKVSSYNNGILVNRNESSRDNNFSKVSGYDKGILVNRNESSRIESVNFGKVLKNQLLL